MEIIWNLYWNVFPCFRFLFWVSEMELCSRSICDFSIWEQCFKSGIIQITCEVIKNEEINYEKSDEKIVCFNLLHHYKLFNGTKYWLRNKSSWKSFNYITCGILTNMKKINFSSSVISFINEVIHVCWTMVLVFIKNIFILFLMFHQNRSSVKIFTKSMSTN